MSKEHFLSYVIPCYNYADIIEETLASIYQQDLRIPFEVVCTDDFSTDEKTREILRSWEKKYSNFHVYFHDKNKGGGCTANTCVKHSKGDLIFYLDSDNLLPAGLVQRMIDHFDRVECDGVCWKEMRFFKRVDGEIKQTKVAICVAPDNLIDLQATCSSKTTCAASGNYLYTRESYDRAGGYPEKNAIWGWIFGFKQGATGSKISILPDSFYWHRYSPEGAYMNSLKEGTRIWDDRLSVIKEFLDVFTEETVKLILSEDWNKIISADKIKIKEIRTEKEKENI